MLQKHEYQGPLAGLNVIDFGHYYAGPMVGMLLADQGANVIRIVRPGEPELPSQQYRLLNRNKKLLMLDIKAPAGKAQALSLIERADVVIENFRPGVMKRLGLDYPSLKDINPGLVYLSLPGFASTDKKRAHIQAWEGILGAAIGLYRDGNPLREMLGFPPVYSWVPLSSMYGGFNGVLAVIASLVAREEHGIGTVIETPLADVSVMAFILNFLYPRNPDGVLPAELQSFKYSSEDSKEIQLDKLAKARQVLEVSPLSSYHPCADSRKIYIQCYNIISFVESFLKALGINKQLKREGFVTEGCWVQGLDNNLCDIGGMSFERKQRFSQLVSETLLTKTAAEWEDIFAEAGIPAAVIRSREEWLALDPMLDSGVLSRLGEGEEALIVPGPLADISGPGGALIDPDSYHEAKPIDIKQANDWFASAFQRKSIARKDAGALKKGDLLKGLKILDLSSIAAGPISGWTLAQYGADVIKADHSPNYFDPALVQSIVGVSQGKRSILTDVTTAPGREIFQRLAAWADVVLHNSVDDTAQRLGASHKQLQAIKSNIVSAQVTTYGGTRRNRGGWENRRGFDPMAQAASGLMAHYGTLEQPVEHAGIACGDITGGFSLAFAALLGVYQQRKTGYGGECRTSLVRSISYSQLPFMIAENGLSDWGEAHGQFAVGDHWWQRLYACNDGWIYVGTQANRSSFLAETVTGQPAATEKALEAAFIEETCAYWLTKLDAANVACHRVIGAAEICNQEARPVGNEEADETASGSVEILRWEDHPCGVPVICPAPNSVRIGEDRSWKRLRSAERLGNHTVEILRELGYGDAEIEKLIRLNVSYEYLPMLGSKDVFLFEPEKQK